MKISQLGEAPDYRFSLANERTFWPGYVPPLVFWLQVWAWIN